MRIGRKSFAYSMDVRISTRFFPRAEAARRVAEQFLDGLGAVDIRRSLSDLREGAKAGRADGLAASVSNAASLSHRFRRRPSCIPSREQAAAEKRAFQRAIAVHAAAPKTGGFAGGVEPRHDLPFAAEHAGV